MPGDVVAIEAGDVVPADGRVLAAATLEVAEAALTGESLPVGKGVEPVEAADAPLGDRTDMVFMNTNVTRGTGEFLSTPATQPVTDRLHVLVVDDEASVRVALQRYLSSRGHEVETTASGKEALARMREDAFDAVIIDMRMPDLSGEQLFGELKARDPSYVERVIFTTGQLVDDGVRGFLASTGRPCVPKPFEFSAFDQVLPARRLS